MLIIDSNDAFDLLGEIIVLVNGTSRSLWGLIKGDNKTYEDIIRDHIFTPLGLNYTTFSPDKEFREYVVVSHTDMPGDSGVVDIDLGFMNPYLPSSPPCIIVLLCLIYIPPLYFYNFLDLSLLPFLIGFWGLVPAVHSPQPTTWQLSSILSFSPRPSSPSPLSRNGFAAYLPTPTS